MTENLQNIPLARDIALAIRAEIKSETDLNASAGIPYNKFLAKLSSDYRKPNGRYDITPEMGPGFVETLPVGKFQGIGPATNAKMQSLGIFTGSDMRNQTLEFMAANLRQVGRILLLDIARRRRTAGARQPNPKIGRRRKHVFKRFD